MPLKSFWIAGFECSCHCRPDGRRLDLIAATGHDRFAAADYARARDVGMATVRDGIRWHLVERSPGRYDFSSLLPKVRAAREAGVQVLWDLCHYG
ncbi:beta-glucosidase, partial [bacterium]